MRRPLLLRLLGYHLLSELYMCRLFLSLNKCFGREKIYDDSSLSLVSYQRWLLIAHESEGFEKYICKCRHQNLGKHRNLRHKSKKSQSLECANRKQ